MTSVSMYHCSGGEGPSCIDLLTPLMEWVEEDVAPEAIVARQVEPVRSRPVYPYPSIATYDGKGDRNDASSYRRGNPLFSGATADWAGADFYRPHSSRQR